MKRILNGVWMTEAEYRELVYCEKCKAAKNLITQDEINTFFNCGKCEK